MTSLTAKIQQDRGGRKGVMETVPYGWIVQGIQMGLVGDQRPIVGFVACAYMAPHSGLELLPTCQGARPRQDQRSSEGEEWLPGRISILWDPPSWGNTQHPR